MTTKLKLLPLAVLASAALVLAACGGSKETAPPAAPTESPAAHANDGANDDDLFVRNGAEVLGRSSTAFAGADVHSFTGEMNFTFKLGQTEFSETAHFASEDPDRFYMEMSLDGGDEFSLLPLEEFGTMKMLSRDGTFYMFMFGAWMSFSAEDLGVEQAEIDKLMDSGSLFDYSTFIKDTANVTYIGDEDVNGHATARYKFQGTVEELFASFSDALGSGGASTIEENLSTGETNTPVTIDLWVGKDDFLPYKLAMTASANTAEGRMELTGEATFDNYNEEVEIPDAPDDAVSMAEFFAEMFAEETPAE